jgi:hypothetical protein
MVFFSQLDPAWKDDPLGTEGGTIGTLGCVVTSVAMAFASAGINTDPGRLNKYLNANKGYQGSLLIWTVAARATAGRIRWCHRGTLMSAEAILAGLSQAKLVIARSNRASPHWVYVRRTTGGHNWKDFEYFDPLDLNPTRRVIGDGWVRPGNETRVLKVLGTPSGDGC